MSFMDFGIIFFKRVCYLGTQFKNLFRIVNEARRKIHEMDMHDSDYVMTCTTEILFISNNLNKLWIYSDLHSYYIQTRYTSK